MTNPPRIVERFFQWFCHQKHLEGLEGDLYERFDQNVKEKGAFRAKLIYIMEVVKLIRLSVLKPIPRISTNNIMSIFFNNLKVALRHGLKRKGFSLINITGLTLGITSILFIALYIQDEVSYDQHISGTENKFRIYNIRKGSDGVENYLPIVPPVFATAFKDNFAQIERIGRVVFDYGGTVFKVGEDSFSETKGVFAEIPALEILDLHFIHGGMNSSADRYSVLLSESMFKKFFGNATFDGQSVAIGSRELAVIGVFKDLPTQSHLELEYVFPFEFAVSNVTEERMNSWIWQQFYTYVEMKPGVDMEDFTDQVRAFVGEKTKDLGEQEFYYTTFFQNIRDIHLHSSNFEWDIAVKGNYQSIIFLTIAAMIILLIAVLNFINLTIAQALKRAKEVSVRKFLGAKRNQLIGQYCFEALLYTLLAGLISMGILTLLLPYFNDFTGKSFTLSYVFSPFHILLFTVFIMFLGFISGIQPALILTSFKPLDIVRGISKVSLGNTKVQARQFLVGAQYLLSIGLIILSLIISEQFSYLRSSDMGFERDNLLVIPLTNSMKNDLESTRAEFTAFSTVSNLTYCYGVPGGIVAGDGIYVPKSGEREHGANLFIVDENYLSTMKMRVIAGRDFSKDIASDQAEGFIINETAVKNFGLESPEKAIGTPVNWSIWGTQDSLKRGRIIGVVEDFNYKSLHNEISSGVLHMAPQYFSFMVLRLAPGDISQAVANAETAYRKFEPTRPFGYEFVDETFDKFYKAEEKLSYLFSIFTGLAIITAGIGLFGLVSFSIVSRAKEISIRKVLGAEPISLIAMLITRYFVMIAICLALAIPATWYIAELWLENFAYHIDVKPLVFLQVTGVIVLLTLFTVGYHALKGAMANPSERLRSE